MGLPSHDIDIAIDDQMGKDFAEKLSEYMKESGRGGEIGSVGVIKSNPDQSKHLETATVRVLGFELDFVNLRAEEYTDSRIPVMRIGTAEEDALRRDLTINALFYNINERSVEDYTGKGMEDIKSGTVRTPLAAQANLHHQHQHLLPLLVLLLLLLLLNLLISSSHTADDIQTHANDALRAMCAHPRRDSCRSAHHGGRSTPCSACRPLWSKI